MRSLKLSSLFFAYEISYLQRTRSHNKRPRPRPSLSLFTYRYKLLETGSRSWSSFIMSSGSSLWDWVLGLDSRAGRWSMSYGFWPPSLPQLMNLKDKDGLTFLLSLAVRPAKRSFNGWYVRKDPLKPGHWNTFWLQSLAGYRPPAVGRNSRHQLLTAVDLWSRMRRRVRADMDDGCFYNFLLPPAGGPHSQDSRRRPLSPLR